jgi:molybdopterin molybdotransferase
MISVEEAQEKILSHIRELEEEERPVLDCLGQVLSQDIYSYLNIPPHDNSAMDGYAVRFEDTVNFPHLSVIGEVACGSFPTCKVEPGTAIRIMTGAPLPYGADVVVPFEDTDEEEQEKVKPSRITIKGKVEEGENIRRRGEDIQKGVLVLPKGTLIYPPEIGVLACLGLSRAPVVRRPVVSIIATGDELAEAGQPLSPGKIYDANTYTVAAQVRCYGGIPRILGIGTDLPSSLNQKIDEGIKDSDLLITSGGVSVGDYDIVKDILARRGKVEFWTVRMKPGKPLAFGLMQGVPHLGLPGNPVSSMVVSDLFVRPAIFKLMGKDIFPRPRVQAVMEGDILNTDNRRIFARVVLRKSDGQYHAHLTGPQGSGILTSMVHADALAIIPENVDRVKKGDMVWVQLLDWRT